MPVSPRVKSYAEKDNVERIIDTFATKEDPTLADLEAVGIVAQVESQLDRYRMNASEMEAKKIRDEVHESKRMAEYLALDGDPRPHSKAHAHAIVSGGHKEAARARAIMAWLKVRIDDPDNGCWLPENTAAIAEMPLYLRKAVPHSRIHRFNYYFWLNREITRRKTPNSTKLREVLRMIELRLQSGSQPGYVMNKKGVGLPG